MFPSKSLSVLVPCLQPVDRPVSVLSKIIVLQFLSRWTIYSFYLCTLLCLFTINLYVCHIDCLFFIPSFWRRSWVVVPNWWLKHRAWEGLELTMGCQRHTEILGIFYGRKSNGHNAYSSQMENVLYHSLAFMIGIILPAKIVIDAVKSVQ